MYFGKTDDPIMDWNNYCAAFLKEDEALPVCEMCGQKITGDCFYRINGDDFCEECIFKCMVFQ